MIEAMPRALPPFLQREFQRGKVYWYVRVNKGPRIRIRGAFDTPEFWSNYDAAIGNGGKRQPDKAAHGTLEWLLTQYRQTTNWNQLSYATRRQRENIFKHVIEAAGKEPVKAITRAVIVRGRDSRRDTPSQARNFLDAMKGLFRWALESDHIRSDPTANVPNPKRPRGPGFEIWTEDEISAFEKHWPRGTKERVWFDVLLYTGLRRGDAVKLGRQHVRDGVATIKTEKTGTSVSIPILSVLRATLDAGPCGDLAYICGVRGEPLTKESFGNLFRGACNGAGVRKSAHGLRKVGATRAANAGASEAELEAIFGWTGGGMAALYTREANRARLARGAIEKLSAPSTTDKAGSQK